MNEEWSANIRAEKQDDGTFVPVLVLSHGTDSENSVRIKIGGLYSSPEEAIRAGTKAVRDMGTE